MVETTWKTWRDMYPETQVMSSSTGFSRDYNRYPYSCFRMDSNLLFPVVNSDDRLHRKTRVLGVRMDTHSKVYQIDEFAEEVEVINEVNESYVVIESSGRNFAMAFSAISEDGIQLTFTAVQDPEVVMEDQEGNRWDLFGEAQEGPRTGDRLEPMFSYTAYWFAWAAFFPGSEIHFQCHWLPDFISP